MKFAYPKFWWKSKNQHGVHSPFVYQLVTQCFYDKNPVENQAPIQQFHQDLSTSKNIDHQTKKSLISLPQAYFLNRVAHYFHIKYALEIGNSLGMESQSFAQSGIERLQVFTEVNTYSEFIKEKLKAEQKIEWHPIQTLEKQLGNSEEKYDLVFIHTENQFERSKNHFEQILPHLHNDSLVIFDNLYLSAEMQELWSYIKNHPKVKVTIDSFYFGFVFFREEQAKENFRIRLHL
ncbi:hypothetical protein [Mesonia sp. K7]|uniref:hypothetical protein n=1 Tax=Mesonia sp. K7 TaxID=2218606 RepID=UPI000DA7FDAF|nr:hypothetical protein [Mesonia sp. K7]PZD79516.1 hypothetical protein DNG35_00470 [Mesonia sp. K7]